MADYQVLAMVAVVLAVVTRGSALPVVAMTAFIALVIVVYDAAVRRRDRRRHARPAGPMADESSHRSDAELKRWMAVVDRVLRSPD